MTTLDPRTPILVGVGAVQQREKDPAKALEPVDLMTAALERAAAAEQSAKLQHTSSLYMTEPSAALAEKLARITPGRLQKSFFTNSGSEANETAIQAARSHTGNHEVVALRSGYSGRTGLAMSLTGQAPWRMAGTGTMGGVVHLANPYCYRCPYEQTYPSCDLLCARDMEQVIQTATSGKIAAFIAEPIQGVGGTVTPPPEYFKIVYDIVRKYGGLCIADEVQTGFGRTGHHYWGFENWDVVPDMVTMAKGIGNGAPLGACTTRPEIAKHMAKRLHFNTFGGNPVSVLQGLSVLEIIDEEHIQQNSLCTLEQDRISCLSTAANQRRRIGEVRSELVGVFPVAPNDLIDFSILKRTKF